MTQIEQQQPPVDDPLARLHKMSTTAGLGVGDYVAINALAVATLVVGIASAMALLDPILLAVPIAAVVLGLFAIGQIRKSSGTQGGLLLAIVGMLAALTFSGWVGAREVVRRSAERVEKDAVITLVDQFGSDVLAGKAEDAWNLFSPTFHDSFNKQQFLLICGTLKTGPVIGKIVSLKSNRFVKLETYADTKDEFAQTMLLVQFQSKQDNSTFNDRYDVVLRKVSGADWKIERLDTFFPPPKVAPPKGATNPNTPLVPTRPGGNAQGRGV